MNLNGYFKPIIVAHRGFSGRAPENTASAFSMAAALQVEMVECDIRLTRDEEVVVFHDMTVNRTTDGIGAVRHLTLSKLKSLDAGRWFHQKFTGEKILTLDEALNILKSFQWINIETKGDGITKETGKKIVEKAIAIIHRHKLQEKMIFSSFDHYLVKHVREVDPSLHTAVIYSSYLHGLRSPYSLIRRVEATGFVTGKHDVRKQMLIELWDNGIPVFIYTLNKATELERWMKRGVTGVITNFPDIALEVRKRIFST